MLIGVLGMLTQLSGVKRLILLEDVELFVESQRGDQIDIDCSCDFEFILAAMPEVAHALHTNFHWVLVSEHIYLAMDNASGQGTKQAREQYAHILLSHNIEII